MAEARGFLRRVGAGALGGSLVGSVICVAWVQGRSGVEWVPYTRGPLLLTLGISYILPFVFGGAVAGALTGLLLPAMHRIHGAVLSTGTAVALFLLTARVLYAGPAAINAGFFGLTLLVALASAVPIGLLIREILRHVDPQLEPLERRTGSLLWRFIDLLQRLPGLGTSLRTRRRARLCAQPFPESWVSVLEKYVPVYARLCVADQQELQRQIMIFLAEKRIEGCGLHVTDAVRVTIAAQACLLTLRLDPDCYSRLRTILVYPNTFRPKRSNFLWQGWQKPAVATLGESWKSGVVILSWKSVREGAADPKDGQNLVFHEFAHQLDQEDGTADGMPVLESPSTYSTWVRVLQSEFEDLKKVEAADGGSVLRFYGTTNPAEFFAVATEAFFERPMELQRERPQLYDELRHYFRQDPAAYVPIPTE